MSKWISVDNELPPENVILLLKVKGAFVKGIAYVNENEEIEYKSLSKRNFMKDIINVTEWAISQ